MNWSRSNVRVNAVAPGFIRTAQILSGEDSLGPVGLTAAEATLPMGRADNASEIGEVIDFLLSDKAGYLTGQTIVVDGGLTVSL